MKSSRNAADFPAGASWAAARGGRAAAARRACARVACAVVCALLLAGCRGPSNSRNWSPNQAVLSTAEISGNLVTVHNIRNTEYRTADDYTVHHYDKTFDLNKLDEVNFIMAPLSDVPGGAHTFLSFGFEGQDYVAISVEVRRKKGEEFSLTRSIQQPYELMYVVGDERDLIQLRTNHWMEDVYMYRAIAPREKMRALFVDMLERANKLAKEPEYYNVVTNNCTTNIVDHVNHIAPNKIPISYQVLFPGFSDRLAYELHLIEVDGSFAHTKQQARINELAYIYRNNADFSSKIRQVGPLARRPGATR